MTQLTIKPNEYSFCQMPFGDKSITHRAFILGALADSPTTVFNAGICLDTLSTAGCLSALGAKITIDGTTAHILPITKPNDDVILNCGNSGTTARLLSGVVSGLGVHATFIGDSSLSLRPMRTVRPLTQMGAKIYPKADALFEIFPSKLHGIDYLSEFPSAQVKSAVLLASLFAEGQTRYVENVPTRDHTERLLQYFGANIVSDLKGIVISNSSRLKGCVVNIPNDMSTAAYFILLGMAKGKLSLKNVLYNFTRNGFVNLIKDSGGDVRFVGCFDNGFEQICDVEPSSSLLQPFICPKTGVTSMIDELPLAMLAACTVRGESKFYGLGELRHKESDRIFSTVELLNNIGVATTVDGDNVTVYGSGEIRGGFVKSYNDHRIAMTAVIAGLISKEGVTVDDVDCIDVSCPNFLPMLGIKTYKDKI